MKKLFLSVLFLSSFLIADSINWVYNYDRALSVAKTQDKLVFLFVSSKDCFFSNYMKNTTFAAPSVKKIISDNFIPVEVERGSRAYPKEKFKTKGTPVIFFLDKNGERVWYPMAGMTNRKRLVFQINNLLISKDRSGK